MNQNCLVQFHNDFAACKTAAQYFQTACTTGFTEIAQHAYQQMNQKNHKLYPQFLAACSNGHLDVAQWLATLELFTATESQIRRCFIISCSKGYLQIAQWLVKQWPKINPHYDSEAALRISCRNGQHHICQWIVDTWPQLLNTLRMIADDVVYDMQDQPESFDFVLQYFKGDDVKYLIDSSLFYHNDNVTKYLIQYYNLRENPIDTVAKDHVGKYQQLLMAA